MNISIAIYHHLRPDNWILLHSQNCKTFTCRGAPENDVGHCIFLPGTDEKAEIKVSLLVEHISYQDKYSPIQIGSYIFSGLQKQIEAKEKKLSHIIPVLLNHGKGKWQYQTL